MKTLHQGFEFLLRLGTILARVFADCYKSEPLIQKFLSQKAFLKNLLLVLSNAASLQTVAQSVRHQGIAETYSKVLLKLCQHSPAAAQFVELKGVQTLKTWLSNFVETGGEHYFNCLRLVVPLARSSQDVHEDLIDAGFDKLLVRHALAASKGSFPRYFLALKQICPREELQVNIQFCDHLISTVAEAFG